MIIKEQFHSDWLSVEPIIRTDIQHFQNPGYWNWCRFRCDCRSNKLESVLRWDHSSHNGRNIFKFQLMTTQLWLLLLYDFSEMTASCAVVRRSRWQHLPSLLVSNLKSSTLTLMKLTHCPAHNTIWLITCHKKKPINTEGSGPNSVDMVHLQSGTALVQSRNGSYYM